MLSLYLTTVEDSNLNSPFPTLYEQNLKWNKEKEKDNNKLVLVDRNLITIDINPNIKQSKTFIFEIMN